MDDSGVESLSYLSIIRPTGYPHPLPWYSSTSKCIGDLGKVPAVNPLYWDCGSGGCRCHAADPATCAGSLPTTVHGATGIWAGCDSWDGHLSHWGQGSLGHPTLPMSPLTMRGVPSVLGTRWPIWPTRHDAVATSFYCNATTDWKLFFLFLV